MPRAKPLIIGLWILALLSVAAYFWQRRLAPPASAPGGELLTDDNTDSAGDGALPVLFAAPGFSFTDQHGRAFGGDELKGRIWIGFIFLTNCPTGACPMMVQKMARLQESLPDERIHFVSFSIDPERDTPEVLAGYARETGGSDVSPRWHLLTGGSGDQMRQFAADFKLAVGEDWGHSTIFLLVDGAGKVRGSFGNEDPEGMTKLRAAAEKLLAETE